MKKLGLTVVLMLATTSAAANEFIPYYGNNPFVFCKVGVPQDCWVPKNIATGEYRVLSRKCFKPWSAKLFSRVCKQAFPNGMPAGGVAGLGAAAVGQAATTGNYDDIKDKADAYSKDNSSYADGYEKQMNYSQIEKKANASGQNFDDIKARADEYSRSTGFDPNAYVSEQRDPARVDP